MIWDLHSDISGMKNDPLQRLTAIKNEIGNLQAEAMRVLAALAAEFGAGPAAPAPTAAPRATGGPAARKAPRRARGGAPRGALVPAVVKVLATAGKPLRAGEIFEALRAAEFPFSGTHPKRTLVARLYQMAGVRSLGDGLFGPVPVDVEVPSEPAPATVPTA